MDKVILNSQRGNIFKKIISLQMDPAMFLWDTVPSKFVEDSNVPRVKYSGSDFYFIFDYQQDGKNYGIYSPSDDSMVKEVAIGAWKEALEVFFSWLNLLKDEVETVDMWAKLEQYMPLEPIEIEQYTAQEKLFAHKQVEGIRLVLAKLKDSLNTEFKIDQEKGQLIQAHFDYLMDCTKHVSPIDWKDTLVRSGMGIAFILNLNPEQTKAMWDVFMNCFKGLLHWAEKKKKE